MMTRFVPPGWAFEPHGHECPSCPWTYDQPDETIFKVEARPDFKYTPVNGSFNKTRCSACGEYVLDRYLRMRDGLPVRIPCSGYEEATLSER